MASGRFREAIIHYKALLKADPSPVWQDGLARAYRGRAIELASKGMLQEAMGIWENRRQFCPGAPPDIEQLFLTLRLGRLPAAASIYKEILDTLEPQTLAEVRRRFAAINLATGETLRAVLAPEDPIIVHGRAARSALEAYCRGDDDQALQSLAQIPYRSPYRDMVPILKALPIFQSDPGEAEKLLLRVPEDSPFAAIAQSVQLALRPEPEFRDSLSTLGPTQRRFVASLRGWSPERLGIWEAIHPLGSQPEPGPLLDLMHRYRPKLGLDWVRRQGMRLLINFRKANQERPHPLFGGTLPLFERTLLQAWRAEEKAGDPWAIYHTWLAVIQHWRIPADPVPGSDNALRIALIQRRLDQRWKMLEVEDESEANWYGGPQEQLDELVLAGLEESLQFDPDDKPTYIRLISYYRRLNKLKEARRLLEPALEQWPDDLSVLGEAVETAVTGGAFKKAAGLAARILRYDPINIRARDALLDAHLAHARKQIKIKRVDLAERELTSAGAWARGEQARGKLALVQGFLEYDRNPKLGATLLLAEVDRHGGGLNGRCALALEAERLGRNPNGLMKALALPMPTQIEKADLLNCLHRLRSHLDATDTVPTPTLSLYLTPGLKAGTDFDLSRQEVELACETLRRCHLQSVRLAYARNGLKRWPGLPVLVLHEFEASQRDNYRLSNPKEIERLEQALKRAREEGDMRTAHRINTLLHDMEPGFPPPFFLPRRIPEEIHEMLDGLDEGKLMDMLREMLDRNFDPRILEQILGRERMEKLMSGLPPDGDAELGPFDPPPRSGRRRR